MCRAASRAPCSTTTRSSSVYGGACRVRVTVPSERSRPTASGAERTWPTPSPAEPWPGAPGPATPSPAMPGASERWASERGAPTSGPAEPRPPASGPTEGGAAVPGTATPGPPASGPAEPEPSVPGAPERGPGVSGAVPGPASVVRMTTAVPPGCRARKAVSSWRVVASSSVVPMEPIAASRTSARGRGPSRAGVGASSRSATTPPPPCGHRAGGGRPLTPIAPAGGVPRAARADAGTVVRWCGI